jgi:uncharacterized membrane protein YheB (UPF0754 family)
MDARYLFLPLVGSLIGWFTNVLAIKLIFHPYKKIYIPFTKLYLQGLIPKRKNEIAATVGRLVEEQLLSMDDVFDLINNKDTKEKMTILLIPALKQNFYCKLPSFIPHSLKNTASNLFEEVLKKETPNMIEKISAELAGDVKKEIKFGPIVQNKIEALDFAGLENLVFRVASKELKHIEILGAILGFIIGFLQIFFVNYLI